MGDPVPLCPITGQARLFHTNDKHGTEEFGFSKPRVSAKIAETWFRRVIFPLVTFLIHGRTFVSKTSL